MTNWHLVGVLKRGVTEVVQVDRSARKELLHQCDSIDDRPDVAIAGCRHKHQLSGPNKLHKKSELMLMRRATASVESAATSRIQRVSGYNFGARGSNLTSAIITRFNRGTQI